MRFLNHSHCILCDRNSIHVIGVFVDCEIKVKTGVNKNMPQRIPAYLHSLQLSTANLVKGLSCIVYLSCIPRPEPECALRKPTAFYGTLPVPSLNVLQTCCASKVDCVGTAPGTGDAVHVNVPDDRFEGHICKC
jgi:hypothetical protein